MQLRSRRQVGARPAGDFELYAWFFMRISGIVLLFIAVFHLLWMHLVIGVDNVTFDLIVKRWENPGWRLYDLALLVFALSHGTNGLRTVIDDYLPRGLANVGAKWLAYLLAVVFGLMGAHIIFTFKAPGVV